MWREGAAAAGLLSVLFVAAVCGVPALALCLGDDARDDAPTEPPKFTRVAASASFGGSSDGGGDGDTSASFGGGPGLSGGGDTEPFAYGSSLMFNSTRPPPVQNPAASAAPPATYNHTRLPRAEAWQCVEQPQLPPFLDGAAAAAATPPL
jgi:hypothetical protein